MERTLRATVDEERERPLLALVRRKVRRPDDPAMNRGADALEPEFLAAVERGQWFDKTR
jgi:hypothetical protein